MTVGSVSGAFGLGLLWSVLAIAATTNERRTEALTGVGRRSEAGYADAAPQAAPAQGAKAPAQDAKAPAPDAKKVLEGTDADDVLNGGDADDWLFGKKGHDFLRGGKGRDTIDGGEGDDILDGGPDADILDGGEGPGSDTIRGGEGDDTLDGGDDDDLLDGGPGNDNLDGGDNNDTLRGGPGDDVLAGADNDDSLSGGPGADRLSGGDGVDNLSGGAGDDIVAGGEGDDALAGDAGTDTLEGGQGNDILRGGTGNDTLLGSWGDDNLDGGEEHDVLIGGDGQDIVSGSTGDDWLLGGLGADTLDAGDGNDLIVVRAGDVGSTETETIDGGSGTDVLILNGFAQADIPALAPSPASSDTSRTAPVELRLTDPLTGGTYRLLNIERIEHTQLITQVGTDANRPASFVFVNPSTTTVADGRIAFFGDDGAALTPSIGGAAVQPTVAFKVPPLGSVMLNASLRDGLMTGSAQVFASGPLLGAVRTTLPKLGVFDAAEAPLVDNAIVPVLEDQSTGAGTGIAIFNSTVGGNIKLTLHTMAGAELGDSSREGGGVEIDMPAHGHRFIFVRDIFPGARTFQGTMTIEGGIDRPQQSGTIAVTGIQRGADGGTLATHPAIPIDPLPTTKTLHFAKLSSGGQYNSSIVLVNPSSANRARGTLAFFDEGGRSWALPVNGQNPAASVPFDLAPRGSVVFAVPAGGGLLQVGSARATAADGVLGAVMRVRGPKAGLVHAGPSGVFAGFITPARRDRGNGVNTEVAIASTGSALALRLVLRDANGAQVAGGTAQLPVSTNGHISRTIDQLFPNAATDTFQGTLTVTADGGTVAAMVTEVSGDASRVVVMPVTPLR